MNRRAFFERIVRGGTPAPLQITAGLEPYKPNENLSAADAMHLLRRATFGYTMADITKAKSMTTSAAVEALFSGEQSPTPPAWVNLDPSKEDFSDPNARQAAYYQRYYEMQRWWFSLMKNGSFSILEKLTFFWHNHFCSDYLKVYYPQYLFAQNDAFRKNAWGDIKQLATKMVNDNAMLIYLDLNASIKGNPNENFARELLELFTLGVNHYTEKDIVEAAKALTGWRVAWPTGTFNAQTWDPNDKTFMGQTGKWNATDVIRIIFEQDACARYFATKFYKYFVYDVPDETIVTELAGILKQNNFQLKPMLKALLGSAHFFDMNVRGAQVKSPLEFMAGFERNLNYLTIPDDYAIERSTKLTLEPLNPPSVEGWKGHHLWINTNSYPIRERTAEAALEGRRLDNNTAMTTKPDVITWAKQFANVNDAHMFVNDAANFLLPIPPGAKTQQLLLEELLQGAQDYEWKIDMTNVEFRLKAFLAAVTTLPEYQLN